MSLRITILGCGSSGGVPRVGQGWGACDPSDPRNRRRRCSILMERISGPRRTSVLVDTSPDLREQLLSQDVQRLDAVLMTHAHADHLHGIDDVRPLVLQMRRRIPLFMDEPTAREVETKFGYVLASPPGSFYPPLFDAQPLSPGVPVSIDGPGGAIDVLPVLFRHGNIDALGFRFGDALYSPDLSAVPRHSEPSLHNLDLWIIDALRYTPHISHISVDQALELVGRFKPKRAVLTNLHTDLDYKSLSARLSPGVTAAFDGMTIFVRNPAYLEFRQRTKI